LEIDILSLNLRSACDMAPAIFYRRFAPLDQPTTLLKPG
jgi:hypothetical protein